MVNTRGSQPADVVLPVARVLVPGYVIGVIATVAVLAVLGTVAPAQAPATAWGHGVIVAVFAVLLPLRLRSAQSGNRGAVRAVGLIASVSLVVNVVEALIPSFVPLWMRVEMVGTGVLMCGVVIDVVRAAARHH